jgi:hypothetical protein
MAVNDDVIFRVQADVGKAVEALQGIGKSLDSLKESAESFEKAAKPAFEKTTGILDGFWHKLLETATGGEFLGDQLNKAFEKITESVKDAVEFLPELVNHVADLGEGFLTMSRQTGISVDALSKFDFIASETGTGIGSITSAIFLMNRQLGENSAQTAAALSRLGLSLEQLSTATPEEAFLKVIQTLHGVTDQSARTEAGWAIFGRQFRSVSQLVEEDMVELGNKAEEMGLTMTKAQAQMGTAFKSAQHELHIAFEGLKGEIAFALMPAFTSAFKEMAKALVDFSKDIGINANEWGAIATEASATFVEAFKAGLALLQPIIKTVVEAITTDLRIVLPIVEGFFKALTEAAKILKEAWDFLPGWSKTLVLNLVAIETAAWAAQRALAALAATKFGADILSFAKGRGASAAAGGAATAVAEGAAAEEAVHGLEATGGGLVGGLLARYLPAIGLTFKSMAELALSVIQKFAGTVIETVSSIFGGGGLTTIGVETAGQAAGALGIGAVVGAIYADFAPALIFGGESLNNFKGDIEGVLGVIRTLGDATKKTAHDIELPAELTGFALALKTGTVDIFAAAAASAILADKTNALATAFSKFSNETLQTGIRLLRQNKDAFEEWAKKIKLPADAIQLLTRISEEGLQTDEKVTSLTLQAQKDRISATMVGAAQQIALAKATGAAALAELKRQLDAGKILPQTYAAQARAQRIANAAALENVEAQLRRQREAAIASSEATIQKNLAEINKRGLDQRLAVFDIDAQATIDAMKREGKQQEEIDKKVAEQRSSRDKIIYDADVALAEQLDALHLDEFNKIQARNLEGDELEVANLRAAGAKQIEEERKNFGASEAEQIRFNIRRAEIEAATDIDIENARIAARKKANDDLRVVDEEAIKQNIELHMRGTAQQLALIEADRRQQLYEKTKGIEDEQKLATIIVAVNKDAALKVEKVWHDAFLNNLTKISEHFKTLGQIAGESLGSILTNAGLAFENFRRAEEVMSETEGHFGIISGLIEKNDEDTVDWGSTLANTFEVAAKVAQGAQAIWAATGKNASAAMNALGGAAAGAQAGAAFGAWGIAIGAAAGLVVGIIRGKPEWARAAADVGRDFGVKISDNLAKALEETEKTEHVGRLTAALMHLGDIIKEGGGLSEKNLGTFTQKLHDVFSEIQRGALTTEQATKIIDDVWPQMTAVIDKNGGLITAQMQELIKLNKDFGTSSEQMQKFVNDQFTKLAAGMKGAVANLPTLIDIVGVAPKEFTTPEAIQAWLDAPEQIAKVKAAAAGTQDEFDRLSRISLAAFNGMIANGQTAVQAITALQETVTHLKQTHDELGLSGNAAYEALARFQKLVTDNARLVESVGSLNDVMLALANTGSLDADTFADLEAQGEAGFKKLTEAGFSQQEALAQMAPMLKTIIKLHNDRGLAIDDETQALIAQAEEQGILGKDQESVQDILKTGLSAIIKALKGDLPAAWATAADAAEKASKRMNKALDETADHVDHLNLGASPGGLKDIPVHLATAAAASDAFLSRFGRNLVNAKQIADGMQLDSTLVSGAAVARAASVIGGQTTAGAQAMAGYGGGNHVHLDHLVIQAWDRHDLRQSVERDLMPLIAENLEDSARSHTWRIRRALGMKEP